MGTLHTLHDEQDNRAAIASRLATTITAVLIKCPDLGEDPIIYAGGLNERDWRCIAATAKGLPVPQPGDEDGYLPSEDTRRLTLWFLRHAAKKLCPDCNLRQASREDRRMIVEGVEICSPCHDKKYRGHGPSLVPAGA